MSIIERSQVKRSDGSSDKLIIKKIKILVWLSPQEVDIITHIRHPNIIKYNKIEFHSYWLYIYMDLALGDLTTVTITTPIKLFHEIVSAVHFLHCHGINHCDIKPENVLIYDQSAKLADFGSAFYQEGRPSMCTTREVLPPEILLDESLYCYADLNAIDVWGLGCILYYLLTGNHLILDKYDLAQTNLENRLNKIESPYREDIEKILHLDPNKRITSTLEILSFNWIDRPINGEWIPSLRFGSPQNSSSYWLSGVKIVVDWLFEIASPFKLSTATIFHSVDLFYRMVGLIEKIPDIQLLGCVSVLLISPMFETQAISPNDMIYVSDNAFTIDDIRSMTERVILKCDGMITCANLYTYANSRLALKQCLPILSNPQLYLSTDLYTYIQKCENDDQPKYTLFKELV